MRIPKHPSFTAWLASLRPAAALAALCLGFAAPAADAPSGALTLDDAVHAARGNNPQLKRAEAASEEASWKPLEALSGHLPSLTLSMSHAFDLKYQLLDITFGGNPTSFPAIYPKTIITAAATLTVFDGLRTLNSLSAAKLGARAASLELERAGLAVESDVRLRFYQALAARQLFVVADQNVKTLEDHLRRVSSLVKLGNATRFDSLRVQVQLEEAIPERQQAEDNASIARRALAVAMGMDDDPRGLVGELPVPDEKRLPGDLKFDPSQRPDLEALRQRAEAASKAHSASTSTWFPKVSLVASKDFYNSNDYSFGNFRDAYYVGFNATWNLFDGGAAISRQKQAAAAQVQADAAARAAVLRGPQEFDQWKRRYLYNTALFNARRRAIEAAEESVRLARVSVQAGTRTHTDLLDAELDLFRARAGLVRAQVDSAEAWINLELALGRKL